MKKTTSYIISGVKADNEEVFMQRIGILLERNDLLEVFSNGVPVSAVIVDEAAFLEYIQSNHKNWNNIEFSGEIEINSSGKVKQYVKFTITNYYRTEEGAKKNDWHERSSKQDDEHPYPGEDSNSDSIWIDENTPGIKVLKV